MIFNNLQSTHLDNQARQKTKHKTKSTQHFYFKSLTLRRRRWPKRPTSLGATVAPRCSRHGNTGTRSRDGLRCQLCSTPCGLGPSRSRGSRGLESRGSCRGLEREK